MEFMLLLAIMTLIGYFIMKKFAPADGGSGSIRVMSEKATTKIAEDR